MTAGDQTHYHTLDQHVQHRWFRGAASVAAVAALTAAMVIISLPWLIGTKFSDMLNFHTRSSPALTRPDTTQRKYFSYRLPQIGEQLDSEIDSWELQLDLDTRGVTRRDNFMNGLFAFLEAHFSNNTLLFTGELPKESWVASRMPSATGSYKRTIWLTSRNPNLQIRHRQWRAGWDEITAKLRRVQDVHHFSPWKHSGPTASAPSMLPDDAVWSKWSKLENDVHCTSKYGPGGGLSYSSTVINATGAHELQKHDHLHQDDVKIYWPKVKEFIDKDWTLKKASSDFAHVTTRSVTLLGKTNAFVTVTFGYDTQIALTSESAEPASADLSLRVFPPISERDMERILDIFDFLRETRLGICA